MMLKIILLSVLAIILATGCTCGCNQTGPALEDNPQPKTQETPKTETTTPTDPITAAVNNPNTQDCGCGK